jgi:hypothetical protein
MKEAKILTVFFNSHSGGWSPNWVHSARRPLLAYCTRPGWLRGWRIRWNRDWQTKTEVLGENLPRATLSTTNPTWPDQGANRAAAVAINRLSYGTASQSYTPIKEPTEMSTRKVPRCKMWPARWADNLAAIYELNVWKRGKLNLSRPVRGLLAFSFYKNDDTSHIDIFYPIPVISLSGDMIQRYKCFKHVL